MVIPGGLHDFGPMANDQYQHLNPPTNTDTHPPVSPATTPGIEKPLQESVSSPTPSPTPWSNPSALTGKEQPKSSRPFLTTFLIGLLIILSVAGTGLALVAYLCFGNTCEIQGRSLVSTASLGKVLTISQIASHVLPLTVPLLMGLASLSLGAGWLRGSTKGDNKPTPMQFGLILSICNSVGIISLLSGTSYLLGFGQPKQRPQSPPILRRSTLLLLAFLLITYLTTATDAWLHGTSQAKLLQRTLPFNASGQQQSLPLSRIVNSTQCDQASQVRGALPFFGESCGMLTSASGGNPMRTAGIRTLSNSSDSHRVVFANDQSAILVPSSIPSNLSYAASSVGIKASCKTITKDCLNPVEFEGSTLYGSNAFLELNCHGRDAFNATPSVVVNALDSAGNPVSGYEIETNPFHAGAVVISDAYSDGTQEDTFVKNTGWFLHGNKGAWNVLYCDMAALDIEYNYSTLSTQFTITKSTPSSLRNARAMISLGLDGLSTLDSVAMVVDGAGIQTNTSYEEAYSLELARQVMAKGAALYIPQDTTELSTEIQIVGTKVDLVPFLIMLATMLLYSCTALFILIQALLSLLSVPNAHFARAYITDPTTLVHAMYGPKDAIYTWQDDISKRFGIETENDRLNIGVVVEDGKERFGIGTEVVVAE